MSYDVIIRYSREKLQMRQHNKDKLPDCFAANWDRSWVCDYKGDDNQKRAVSMIESVEKDVIGDGTRKTSSRTYLTESLECIELKT